MSIEDFRALRDYLTIRGHIRSDEARGIQNAARGISNRTVQVVWADGWGWVLRQALAKLRVSGSALDGGTAVARRHSWMSIGAGGGKIPIGISELPGSEATERFGRTEVEQMASFLRKGVSS